MRPTAAKRIARHLHRALIVTAAGHSGTTWGYHVATGPRRYTLTASGSYRAAQASRRESMADMIDQLTSGTAPDWMSEDFQW